jgi:hypothetical protein
LKGLSGADRAGLARAVGILETLPKRFGPR